MPQTWTEKLGAGEGEGAVEVAAATGMPAWKVGELGDAPRFTRRSWAALIGPGLMMAGSAIGSGEWLLGPAVSARYGGALLWLCTLSVLGQLIYNLEASRYTLYTGEPIMTGKFRLMPGPLFWFALYLILDFGAILPYQIANIATTVAAVWLGRIPDPAEHGALLQSLTYVLLFVALLPLLVGGKIYNSLKAIMTVKVVVVLGFLLFLAVFFSSRGTWAEIVGGFFKFGNVPVTGGGGANVDNIFLSLWRGAGWPQVDHAALPLLTAFAAIAGVGGLAQTTISNYTRDQGWGMGAKTGAIPSIIGGRNIELSHTGTVFRVTAESLKKWRGWRRHVLRDQLAVWMPAAFIGLALPSMLSVEFLPRGATANQWVLAGMTADGVAARVGGPGSMLGAACWYLVLLCGFLVLLPNAASNADGFIRRWVDVSWTAVKKLHTWEPRRIGKLYFAILICYLALGVFFLSMARPMGLIVAYGNLGNLALAVSCWHTLFVNVRLLPSELRPGWAARAGLLLAGVYFFTLALLTLAVAAGWI
jgi:hypothetical protein